MTGSTTLLLSYRVRPLSTYADLDGFGPGDVLVRVASPSVIEAYMLDAPVEAGQLIGLPAYKMSAVRTVHDVIPLDTLSSVELTERVDIAVDVVLERRYLPDPNGRDRWRLQGTWTQWVREADWREGQWYYLYPSPNNAMGAHQQVKEVQS